MASNTETVKSELLERFALIPKVIAQNDREGLLSMFAEDVVVMRHLEPTIKGKKAAAENLKLDQLKSMGETIEDEIQHLEMVNEDTAFVVRRITFAGGEGSPKIPLQATLVWKKINGVWYIQREMYIPRVIPKTPSDLIKKELEATLTQFCADFVARDFDAMLACYHDDCRQMAPGLEPITGKKGVRELLTKARAAVITSRFERMVYFELFNDTTAYTNSHYVDEDENGKATAYYSDTLLWRKVEGKWLIASDMHRQRVPEESDNST